MPEATNTVTIARPPAEVFAFLADGTNDLKWRTGVMDVERVSGEGRGAVYRQGVKGPMGRRVPADYEIVDWNPDERIAFQATAGPVRPQGSYELTPDGGGTRVVFSLRCTLTGAKRLMAPMVARAMEAEVGELERLKQVLEDAR